MWKKNSHGAHQLLMVNDFGSAVCWSELKIATSVPSFTLWVFLFFFFYRKLKTLLRSLDELWLQPITGVRRICTRALVEGRLTFSVRVNSERCSRGNVTRSGGGDGAGVRIFMSRQAAAVSRLREADELRCAAFGWQGGWGDWGWSLEIASRGFESFTASNGFGKPIKAA